MKKLTIFLVTIIAVSLLACSPPPKKEKTQKQPVDDKVAVTKPAVKAEAKPLLLEKFSDKLSYVLGLDIGASLGRTKADIDFAVLQQGILDSYNKKDALLSPAEVSKIKEEFSRNMREEYSKMTKKQAETNLEEGQAFLEENKTKEGVVVTASGLQYKVLKAGDGLLPAATDRVKVHYTGSLIDGTEFDSSIKRKEPAVFPVKGVIPGWTEALLLMKVGSKYKLFIPSQLAYNERAVGQLIGPNSTLIFEVELLAIEK